MIKRLARALGVAAGAVAIVVYGFIGLAMFACGGGSCSVCAPAPPKATCVANANCPADWQCRNGGCTDAIPCNTAAQCQALDAAVTRGCGADKDCNSAGESCVVAAGNENVCVERVVDPCAAPTVVVAGTRTGGGVADFCGESAIDCDTRTSLCAGGPFP
jgi:hypothetical protein